MNWFQRILFPRQRFRIIDANDELRTLFMSDLPNCSLELRERGVLIRFSTNQESYGLALPYRMLSVFKGSDYLQIYGGKWRVKMITNGSGIDHKIIRKMLQMKYQATVNMGSYYG